MKVIDDFRFDYRWLSNFHECNIEGWGSTEAFYQAMKTKDESEWERFKTLDPKTSKKEGRKLTLREDWDALKDGIMFAALSIKFEDHLDLRQKLIDTHPAILIEGNTWHDNYWGDCRCWTFDNVIESKRIGQAECKAPGKNMLGHQLMIIRASWVTDDILL